MTCTIHLTKYHSKLHSDQQMLEIKLKPNISLKENNLSKISSLSSKELKVISFVSNVLLRYDDCVTFSDKICVRMFFIVDLTF